MDLPYSDSISTACVFMEILKRLAHNPKNNNTKTSCQLAVAKGININVRGKNIEAYINNCLLPNLEISQPESGKLSSCPTGSANNIAPNAASVSCSLSLISGIRLAQLALVIPAIKKNTLTAILCSLLFTDKEIFIVIMLM